MAKHVTPIKRVTRRELKEDKLVTTVVQAQEFFQKNLSMILKIGGGAILIIAVIAFMIISKKRSEVTAAYELSLAFMTVQQSGPGTAIEKFKEINDRYSGTKAAAEALFYYAQIKHADKNFEAALEGYQTFLNKSDHKIYYYTAVLAGKAACLEDLKRFEEAAESYLKAAACQTTKFARPAYQLDAARCYRAATQKAKALELYELVKENSPGTPYAREAEKEAKRI